MQRLCLLSRSVADACSLAQFLQYQSTGGAYISKLQHRQQAAAVNTAGYLVRVLKGALVHEVQVSLKRRNDARSRAHRLPRLALVTLRTRCACIARAERAQAVFRGL